MSPIGFSSVFLLLILLVLGGVGLVVVVVMRRGATEEGGPGRARRIGCVLLGIVVLVGGVIVFNSVNAPRSQSVEPRVFLHGGTAQLFVGGESVGVGEAEIRLDIIELIPLVGTSEPSAVAEQFFPGQKVSDARAGSSATFNLPDRTFEFRPIDVLVQGEDGRVDSAVVVVIVESEFAAIIVPTPRAFVLRARDGKNRTIRSGAVEVSTRGTNAFSALLGLPIRPHLHLDITVDPTPTRLQIDGAEPSFVVDDFVTQGGIPTPR